MRVARQGDGGPQPGAQGEEDLSAGGRPHLRVQEHLHIELAHVEGDAVAGAVQLRGARKHDAQQQHGPDHRDPRHLGEGLLAKGERKEDHDPHREQRHGHLPLHGAEAVRLVAVGELVQHVALPEGLGGVQRARRAAGGRLRLGLGLDTPGHRVQQGARDVDAAVGQEHIVVAEGDEEHDHLAVGDARPPRVDHREAVERALPRVLAPDELQQVERDGNEQ
mmetsp:Transcript_32371/g.87746  ORF Transcript_32371/g.87746 Transcript_32371/m.87746 type:complete len:221 (-) Transcript_32371:136-798(-)